MPDVRLIDANALIKQIEETHCKDCPRCGARMEVDKDEQAQ